MLHLCSILIDIKGGEAVDAVAVAEASVGVIPRGAVHMPDGHTIVSCRIC